MALVNATIKNRITSVSDDVELVCNNPTDVIEIDFDEEWSGKTGFVARFEWNGKYFDVPFTGNKVQVPEISNTGWIMFGVYADNITAAPTKIKCKKSILCYGDGVRQVPANPFYDEFVERLENVEEALEHSGGGSGGIAEETDPTVPAWAKQPEKPTYTAEEVGAQPKGDYASRGDIERLSEEIGDKQPKGDYALKSEIPAPYTLPTASSTVKGGVMIGEGLQMDGDVLGVAPEGVYELIETITLEEAMAIERTAEPDGTPYKFIAVSGCFKFTNVKNTEGYVHLWCNTKEIGRAYLSKYTDALPAYISHECRVDNGRWLSWYRDKPVTKETSSAPNTYYGGGLMKNKIADYPAINRILIDECPAGTTIEIWGVRANA